MNNQNEPIIKEDIVEEIPEIKEEVIESLSEEEKNEITEEAIEKSDIEIAEAILYYRHNYQKTKGDSNHEVFNGC